MTLEQAHKSFRQHGTPRLRLKPKVPRTGYVDGAWWPRRADLTTELPDLIAKLSFRLGAIDRVTYNLNEWIEAPAQLGIGWRAVQIDGRHRQPSNTFEVLDANRNKIVLLVVSSLTDPDDAHAIVMAAAAPNDASSVDALLMISEQHREGRARATAAQTRWESQGRSQRSTSRNRRRPEAAVPVHRITR